MGTVRPDAGSLGELRGVGSDPAVVLGLNPNALGTIRALARSGIPVVAIGPKPAGPSDVHGWMSSRTRMARRVLVDRAAWPRILPDVLLACAQAWHGRGVLMPSGDTEVEVLLKNRGRLAERFHLMLPDEALVATFSDKVAFSRFAAERGVPAPRTLAGLTLEELETEVHRLRLPCIVKPDQRDDRWEARFGVQKVIECEDVGSLMDAYRHAGETHRALVVQEVVPGRDDRLVFSHVYVGRDGKELALWTGHKVRQLPVHYGTSTLARTRWDEEAATLTRRLLEGTGFAGYASVEFKIDPRDNSRRALEVTVGRTWYPHGLGVAAGVNLPLIWYRDALNQGVPQLARQREGVAWMDEYRDVIAAFEYRRRGELTLGDWCRSLLGVRACAHLAWDDPLPGLFLVARFLLGAAAAIRRLLRHWLGGGRSPARRLHA